MLATDSNTFNRLPKGPGEGLVFGVPSGTLKVGFEFIVYIYIYIYFLATVQASFGDEHKSRILRVNVVCSMLVLSSPLLTQASCDIYFHSTGRLSGESAP